MLLRSPIISVAILWCIFGCMMCIKVYIIFYECTSYGSLIILSRPPKNLFFLEINPSLSDESSFLLIFVSIKWMKALICTSKNKTVSNTLCCPEYNVRFTLKMHSQNKRRENLNMICVRIFWKFSSIGYRTNVSIIFLFFLPWLAFFRMKCLSFIGYYENAVYSKS